MTLTIALLATALLFGGMVLYSFGFAAFMFSALPGPVASGALRAAFPHFYLFVIGASGVAAGFLTLHDSLGAVMLAVIAATTIPARQILMPAINTATDTGAKGRFKALHGFSVAITLAHIVLAAVVLARFL